MADAENVLPPSKKRAAGREISRDNPGLDDEEDVSEQEVGTFKRASDEVLATRRMVKVRRQPTAATPSSNPFAGIRLVPPTDSTATPAGNNDAQQTTPAPSNPFAGIQLVPPAETTATPAGNKDTAEATASDKEPVSDDLDGNNDVTKDSEKLKEVTDKPPEGKEGEAEAKPVTDADKGAEKTSETNSEAADLEAGHDEKAVVADKGVNEEQNGNNSDSKDPSAGAAKVSSFQQLSSSQNAFTGLAGTGGSTPAFSFGSTLPSDSAAMGSDSGPASKNDQPTSFPSFGFGLSNNGNSSLFGTTGGVSVMPKSGDVCPPLKEVPVETGEENEQAVFQADSVLFEFIDGGWKERGKGEVKVNISKGVAGKARLVMRSKGNYRLILNASLFPDMKLTNMDKKGITFACINSTAEGQNGFSTFALKFKDGSIVEEFRGAVMEHKGKEATVLKTPENSPKASGD